MNDDAAALPPPPVTSRSEFIAALRWGFEQAVAGPARRIVCVDADFADWPLDDLVLYSPLTAWLRMPQRRLVLLAAQFDTLPRRHPRFVAWRKLWSHAIEAWLPPEEMAAALPTLLVDDAAVSVHLRDAVHWRGRAEFDRRSARSWQDQIDAVLQRSEPAFAANPLGL
jgi:hypothetical protein